MNLFIIDKDPEISAKHLCNEHVIKMITETCQMLACACIRHNVPNNLLPLTKGGTVVKGGYHKHPCSVWVGNTDSNFIWTVLHGLSMCKEYTERYDKVHFCQKGIEQLSNCIDYIPKGDLQPFAVAINPDKNCQKVDRFQQMPTVVKYRLFYKLDKPFATWKKNKPFWMNLTIPEIISI